MKRSTERRCRRRFLSATGIPDADTTVNINGANSVTLSGQDGYAAQLLVRNGSLSILNGTLYANAGTTAYGQWGIGANDSTSILYIGTGGKLVNTRANIIFGGGNNATNLIDLDGGVLSVSNMVMFGMATGGEDKRNTTTLVIRNGGQFLNSGITAFGRDAYSTGILSMSGGVFSTSNTVNIGDNQATSVGVATVSGGTFKSALLAVGNVGSGSMLVSNAGTTVSVSTLTIGNTSTSVGTMTVTNGATLTVANGVTLGFTNTNVSSAKGTLTVSGTGTRMYVNATGLNIGRSQYNESLGNTSAVTIENNATASISGNVNVGLQVGAAVTGSGDTATSSWTAPGSGELNIGNGATLTLASGTINVGLASKGVMTVDGGTISMPSAAASVFVGGQTRLDSAENGKIFFSPAGQGTVSMNNATWDFGTAVANQRLYIAQTGTGSVTLTNSSINNLTLLQVGTYLQRGLAVNATTYGGTTISTVAGQGTGYLTLNQGSVIDMRTFQVEFGTGGTGSLTVNGGKLTTSGNILLGYDAAPAISTSQGGVMTSSFAFLDGHATYLQTSGTVSANALLMAAKVNGTLSGRTDLSNAVATISGGSLSLKQLTVGVDTVGSNASFAVSNNASVKIDTRLNVSKNGALQFIIAGDSPDDFGSAPIIDATGAVFGMNADGDYSIDLSGYNSTGLNTITLMVYDSGKAQNIAFNCVGLGADYEILGGNAQWGDTALTITLVPEPSAAVSLFGLLALAFVVRRRR